MDSKSARKKLDSFYIGIRMLSAANKKARYAKKRVKMINGGYRGSIKEFKRIVVPYWKKYGIIPRKYWYDLFCAGLENYDPRYIPDDIWYKYVMKYFNDFTLADALGNKGLMDRIFPLVKQPSVIVKNLASYFYTENNVLINKKDAIDLCVDQGKIVIKPISVTGGGRNVRVIETSRLSRDDIGKLFEEYKEEFIVQRFLKQHSTLACIHADSLNTIRVVTFHFADEVHVLSAMLRMGVGDSMIDNVSAGGVACQIMEDGWLCERAVTRRSEWLESHPDGMKFKDIRIPSFKKIIEKAKELHLIMPYFHIIGWDFSIAEDGEPVMIEYNTGCEQNQIACGPTFGEMTDKVLEEIFLKKSKRKHNGL